MVKSSKERNKMKKEISSKMKSLEMMMVKSSTKINNSMKTRKISITLMMKKTRKKMRSLKRRTSNKLSMKSAMMRMTTQERNKEEASKKENLEKSLLPSQTRRRYSKPNPKDVDTYKLLDIMNLLMILTIQSLHFFKSLFVVIDEGPIYSLQTSFIQGKSLDFLLYTPRFSIFILINIENRFEIAIWPILNCSIFYV